MTNILRVSIKHCSSVDFDTHHGFAPNPLFLFFFGQEKMPKKYSTDLLWRIIALRVLHCCSYRQVCFFIQVSRSTAKRTVARFRATGNVSFGDHIRHTYTSKLPLEVVESIRLYVEQNPACFLDEIISFVRLQYPDQDLHLSLSTMCRVLYFQLRIRLKSPTKVLLKTSPFEQFDYLSTLSIYYSNPEQLLFVDECSVTSRDVHRGRVRAPIGSEALMGVREERGPTTISVLACFDVRGFVSWTATKNSFTRNSFNSGFISTIVPVLNCFPLPRSIVVMDNCRMHLYRELEQLITACGAVLLYNAPRSPWLAPIEKGFSAFKRFLRRHMSNIFDVPFAAIDHSLLLCGSGITPNLFGSCGYLRDHIDFSIQDPGGMTRDGRGQGIEINDERSSSSEEEEKSN